MAAAAMLVLLAVDLPDAQAQVEGNRVEFDLTIDDRHIHDDLDGDLRSRQIAEISIKVAERIEKRLDAIGIKNHEVEFDGGRNLRVTAFGNHSEPIIKGAVIPSGRLEIRPVLVNDSPWADLSAALPDNIELRSESGIFRTDRLYLFSFSSSQLWRALQEHSPDGEEFEIFPDGDGWRSLRLGPPAATDGDVQSVRLRRNPAGIPFVALSLSAQAAQEIRSSASSEQVRHLAIVLDGEVVGLHPYSERGFSETLTLDPPTHLSSVEARDNWAMQVAGRLAAPIPVRLVETQE